MGETIRVAAAQFEVGSDIEVNLQTCLRMIENAAQYQPDILVLPEFCNHAAWYNDTKHAYQVALDVDGFFTQAIAEAAKQHNCYIMLNATVRREHPTITGTNLLFSPDGELIAESDKQVLMGNENNFLTPATSNCPIIETPIARLGMYSCMDGVIFETARGMAVRGAQVLLDSLNSFARDEGTLHIPVRAGENKVFIVAANKVGLLVPEDLANTIAERMQISPDDLHGAGHSQIVAPDGTVLAEAPSKGEAVVWADITPALADDKCRPDGTDIMATRRPELYQPLAIAKPERENPVGAQKIKAAIYQPQAEGEAVIDEVIAHLPALNDVDVLVLPELAFMPERTVNDVAFALEASDNAVDQLIQALIDHNSALLIATSIVSGEGESITHTGVIISQDGVQLRQQQLHADASHNGWVTEQGNTIQVLDTDFGRVGMVVGNDAIYPETFRLHVLKDVEVVLVPAHIQERWEVTTGLLERSAENRMNLVVSSRKTDAGSGMILALDEDFTLWTEWKNRPFDGNINRPIINHLPDGEHLLIADVFPATAQNRTISQKSNLVENRPIWLADALVTRQ